MAKDKEDAAPPQTVTVTLELLNQLIDDRAKNVMAQALGRPFDDEMKDRMDRMRGKDRPLPPEEEIHCRSPITGSTFRARVTMSRNFPAGRVVEMLDYVRPDGADRHLSEGGLYDGPLEWTSFDPKATSGGEDHYKLNKGNHKFLYWLYENFWQKDWMAISGKPASFLAQWRLADKAAE